MDEQLIQLSRTLAYALRHRPDRFALTPDNEGWVSAEDLLAAIRARDPALTWANVESLQQIIEDSDKQRFELLSGSIRALYGHSLSERAIARAPAEPPARLFHGTTPQAGAIILTMGLVPMRRQHVHLSVDLDTAEVVARRRTGTPLILAVDARAAHDNGVHFYRGNDTVWLADSIPAHYIRAPQSDAP